MKNCKKKPFSFSLLQHFFLAIFPLQKRNSCKVAEKSERKTKEIKEKILKRNKRSSTTPGSSPEKKNCSHQHRQNILKFSKMHPTNAFTNTEQFKLRYSKFLMPFFFLSRPPMALIENMQCTIITTASVIVIIVIIIVSFGRFVFSLLEPQIIVQRLSVL